MVLTEEIVINGHGNPIVLKPCDEDGFKICETADGEISAEIYFYYCDKKTLIGILQQM